MKVKLIDENTYGIFDDSGIEVGKGAITAEMRKAVRRNKTLSRVVKEHVEADLGKAVDDIPAELVQPVEPVTVPFHEHEFDDRYAATGHEHAEYQKAGELTPHLHDDYQVLSKGLDGLKTIVENESAHWSNLLTNHKHDQYASQFHAHEDVLANLNILARQIAETRALIPAEAPAHQHNDFADAIAILRSEITSLRQALDFERGKRAEDADSVRSFVQSEIEASRPQLDGFATKEDLGNINLRSGRFRLRVLSKQNIDGQDLLTVEEIT